MVRCIIFEDDPLHSEQFLSLLKHFESMVEAGEKCGFEVIFTTVFDNENLMEIRPGEAGSIPESYNTVEHQDDREKSFSVTAAGWQGQKPALLKTNTINGEAGWKTIWIATNGTYDQLPIRDVIYCESDNQYTAFFARNEKGNLTRYLSSVGIGRWEKDLRKYRFCRIHRRYLVNLNAVEKYVKGDGGWVVLSTGQHLDVSKGGKVELLRMTGIKL